MRDAEVDPGRLRGALARGRGLIFVTGHLGNWELMARRTARAGIACATIATSNDEPGLNAIFEKMRGDAGHGILHRDAPSMVRSMVRCFRENELLGILIDQDTRARGAFVPVFGRMAFTPRAVGDLALRFRAPVVVGWSRHPAIAGRVGLDAPAVEAPAAGRVACARGPSGGLTGTGGRKETAARASGGGGSTLASTSSEAALGSGPSPGWTFARTVATLFPGCPDGRALAGSLRPGPT